MPPLMMERVVSERLWAVVRPMLPEKVAHPRGGRPRSDDWACFEAVVYVLRNGVRWRDLPSGFPSPATCWRRHREWTAAGVWEKAWKLMLDEVSKSPAMASSTPHEQSEVECLVS